MALNSLVYRVFKAKYFKDCNFIHATLGNNPSYSWISILTGQEVVRKGIRWRVGNGRSIQIWEDQWLPNSPSYKVISSINFSSWVSLVSGLIDVENKCQNLGLIRSIFLPFEAERIEGIPLSNRLTDNKQIWGETSNGFFFTIRSAYKTAMDHISSDQGLVLLLMGEVCIYFGGSFGRSMSLIR